MGKHIAKVGFFEPGLVTSADFMRFKPYQCGEFCLLAREAGLAASDIAEMMRVPVDYVRTVMAMTFNHNPFRSDPKAADGEAVDNDGAIENRSTLARKHRVAMLGHIEAGEGKIVTVTYANLSRVVGLRQKAMLSILQKMRDGGYVEQLREGRASTPAVLRLTAKGEAALARWREVA